MRGLIHGLRGLISGLRGGDVEAEAEAIAGESSSIIVEVEEEVKVVFRILVKEQSNDSIFNSYYRFIQDSVK